MSAWTLLGKSKPQAWNTENLRTAVYTRSQKATCLDPYCRCGVGVTCDLTKAYTQATSKIPAIPAMEIYPPFHHFPPPEWIVHSPRAADCRFRATRYGVAIFAGVQQYLGEMRIVLGEMMQLVDDGAIAQSLELVARKAAGGTTDSETKHCYPF